MKRESHLFACHKYLEETGSQILAYLAKVDFRNLREIENIRDQIKDYMTTIENHSRWEEEFIFNKFFAHEELPTFFGEHADLEDRAKKIIEEFKDLLNLDSRSRVYKGKLIYLDFRIFFASNLVHFYDEETILLNMLQDRATDDEIRVIDKPIYQNMSSSEIVEMLEFLLPPISFSEKKNILDDLKNFNPINFEGAIPEIRKILTQEEAAEIFR